VPKYRMLCKAFAFFDVVTEDDEEAIRKAEKLKVEIANGLDLPKGAMVEGLPFDPEGDLNIMVYLGAISPPKIVTKD